MSSRTSPRTVRPTTGPSPTVIVVVAAGSGAEGGWWRPPGPTTGPGEVVVVGGATEPEPGFATEPLETGAPPAGVMPGVWGVPAVVTAAGWVW